MELILVRHAQPQWTYRGAALNDPGLSDLGWEQARLVADRLGRGGPAEELLVSTARRSQETAKPIAELVDPTPVSEAWLHEIRLPSSWDGTPAEEIGKRLAEARWRPREEWWDGLSDAGGESFRDFHARVVAGLDAALADRGVRRHGLDPDHLWDVPDSLGRIIIVAHAGTNSVLIGHLLGVQPQPWEWERFSSAHASVTVLETIPISQGHIFSLKQFSDVSHFSPEQVTR